MRNYSKFTHVLEKILRTLVEFDSEMCFLKLSNDPENGTQYDSEGLKIVRKFKNYSTPPQIPQLLITCCVCISSPPYKNRLRRA